MQSKIYRDMYESAPPYQQHKMEYRIVFSQSRADTYQKWHIIFSRVYIVGNIILHHAVS